MKQSGVFFLHCCTNFISFKARGEYGEELLHEQHELVVLEAALEELVLGALAVHVHVDLSEDLVGAILGVVFGRSGHGS